MESRNIIIILIVIIVILALMIGITVLHPFDSKEPTKVKITGNKTLTEGDGLSIKLTDLNNSAIPKEKVNITIKNSKGKVVANKTVKTNSKGNAKLDLNLKKGKYSVNVTYAGNENYTGNGTTQKLTVKEKVIGAQLTSSGSNGGSSGPSDWYDSDGAHHYYENGQEYVGDPNRQHFDIDTYNYVKEHGMGD